MNQKTQAGSPAPTVCSDADGPHLTHNASRSDAAIFASIDELLLAMAKAEHNEACQHYENGQTKLMLAHINRSEAIHDCRNAVAKLAKPTK